MADMPNPNAGGEPSIENRLTALFAREQATKEHRPQPRTAPEPEAPVQVETRRAPPEAEAPEQDAQTEGETPDREEPPEEEQPQELELDAEQQDEAPPPTTLRIKHNGQELDLPESEVIELAQKGYDYERKTQALSESAASTHAILKNLQSLQTAAPQLVQELAGVRAIQAEMQTWQNVNWVQLAQTVDSTQYNQYRAYYDSLQQRYAQAATAYQTKAKAMDEAQTRAIDQLTDVEARKLPDLVPEFRNPDKAAKISKEIESYLLKRGVPDFLVKDLRFASVIAVAYDGLRYQQQRAKQSVQSQVANKQLRNAPPLTKPQASQSRQQTAQRDYAKVRQEHKKHGDLQSAASLLARMYKG